MFLSKREYRNQPGRIFSPSFPHPPFHTFPFLSTLFHTSLVLITSAWLTGSQRFGFCQSIQPHPEPLFPPHHMLTLLAFYFCCALFYSFSHNTFTTAVSSFFLHLHLPAPTQTLNVSSSGKLSVIVQISVIVQNCPSCLITNSHKLSTISRLTQGYLSQAKQHIKTPGAVFTPTVLW